jgi:hypothetical protein
MIKNFLKKITGRSKDKESSQFLLIIFHMIQLSLLQIMPLGSWIQNL